MRTLSRATLATAFAALALAATGCAERDAARAIATDAPGPWNGTYAGVAISDDPGLPEQSCPARVPMNGFKVAGDYAEFGMFAGKIDAGGNVTMQNRSTWIWGQLGGGEFNGRLRFNQICQYTVRLIRQ